MSYIGLLTEMMARIGRVHLPTLEDSMWPTICPGDTLEVIPLGEAGPQVGQVVIIACDPTRFAVHRVVGVTNDRVILVGDNRPLLEAPTPIGDVFGRVVAVLRGGQRIHLLDGLPFPTEIRESDPCGRIECIQVIGAGDEPVPGLTPVAAESLEDWIRTRQDAGIPVLLLAEQGRGDFRTLAHFATHYPKVALVTGVLAGYGYTGGAKLDPELVTEAVRLPVAGLADLPPWLEALQQRFAGYALPSAMGL